MSTTQPAFVFVHGAWSNAATWRQVMPHLEARGFVARALDLPGTGVHARVPKSYGERPFGLGIVRRIATRARARADRRLAF
jgi:alpha-beta hydrolase superfamily lysophospholipase